MEDELCGTEDAEQGIRDDGIDSGFRGLRGGGNLPKNRDPARPLRFKPLYRQIRRILRYRADRRRNCQGRLQMRSSVPRLESP